jgi:UDP-N-acetylmuramoyl-L-alanyl-D-glutamate--2,6-diaminopimelate ligase
MLLSELLKGIQPITEKEDRLIHNIQTDSRKINEGDLFIALPQAESFIDSALEKNVATILIDTQSNFTPQHLDAKHCPIIKIDSLKQTIGTLAARFYHEASTKMHVVGITGTNGKTSCSQFIAQALSTLTIKTAVIGTLGTGFVDALHESTHTTPDVIRNHQLLADFYQNNATHVAMEVSSHALDQGRIDGIQVKTAIFTNLTHDHLDYHQTLEAYGEAKKKLFIHPNLQQAIINADDPFGKTLLLALHPVLPCFAYALQPHADLAALNIPMVIAKNIITNADGIHATVETPWGTNVLETHLLGRFNLHNVLATLTYLCSQNISLEAALNAVSKLHAVDGRMQRYGGIDSPLIVIDYAHTPDALEKALQALREHCTGQLYCVFGCGGSRDKSKRPAMGKYAETYADHLIITNDNPRHDIPEEIAADICKGLQHPEKATIELDRKQAIQDALTKANQNDIVLIAGKGHETTQHIGDHKIPFNDAHIVLHFLKTRGSTCY